MVDVTVSRTIIASPEAVWALVSDPTRMGEWSPENLGATWLGEVTGAAEGAQFRGSNKNGRIKWKTKCTVTECAENEAFAFDVKSGVIPIANKVLQVDSRAEFNRSSMETTLAAMAAEVEVTS
jgi:hypothetical protein